MKSKQEMRKARCYISAPLTQVLQIEGALYNNPFVETYASTTAITQHHGYLYGQRRGDMIHSTVKEYLDWVDVVVVSVDPEGEPDAGHAFELGYAVAKGKPVILLQGKVGAIPVEFSESCHAYLQSLEQLEQYNFLTMPEILYPKEEQ